MKAELSTRIASLREELPELEVAERVLSRLTTSENFVSYGERVVKETPTGKPPDTPTTPDMITKLLREAQIEGKQGLEPREMTAAIAKRWWPTVKSEDIGPTAWRMAKEGRLKKEGPVYMLTTVGAPPPCPVPQRTTVWSSEWPERPAKPEEGSFLD